MLRSPRRIEKLPPFIFAEMDRLQAEAVRAGKDIIGLGTGDPDQPTPEEILDAMGRATANPAHHRYPPYLGSEQFRQAVASWYDRRFSVSLDPEREVLALIGSKEGIVHMTMGWAGQDDLVLVPDPAYPVYQISAVLAGAECYFLPLEAENGFLPDLESIPSGVAARAKLLFLNYPNNPTGAVANLDFFERAVWFARKHELVVCNDLAYSEVAFDGYVPPSILQVPGAKEVAVEFHSLSKTFNMTGWRLGMAVGGAEWLQNLKLIKLNVDSGQFGAIQQAGAEALLGSQEGVQSRALLYQRRRDLLVGALERRGLQPLVPKATFYVWCPVPAGYSSMEFSLHMLQQIGVVTVPGIGFGQSGEGYVRFALTVPDRQLEEAAQRLSRFSW